MIAIDNTDEIVKCLAKGGKARFIDDYKDLKTAHINEAVIFRSMTQRKTVALCEQQTRNYFYIDTGYIGNLEKRKVWHRVVPNNMQHTTPNYNLPDKRFKLISKDKPYLPFTEWKTKGSAILIVTPSDKPCMFYGVDRDTWLNETITELKKYTDRPIIVRDKLSRRERVGANNIYNQFINDNIYAVVTYNSIAAIEAIGFGIPAFTLAPTAADDLCLKDLSKIESPLYSDTEKVVKWQHWLGYCQYTPKEMLNGSVFKLIEEYNLQ